MIRAWRTLSGGLASATRADLRCKADTDYLTVAYGRLAAIQETWLRENPTVLPQREALLRKQDAAARAVLGQSS